MAVVKANYCEKGDKERETAKANIYYIQTRPGRDKQRITRTLFGPGGALGRREAYQFITDAPKGTYFYRLKLSPDPKLEDVKRDLNMQKLTRSLMKHLDKRLKTAIPWAAALHDDHTDIRHVHILAAIPKHLQEYDLEFLIREATQISLSQRRFLERGVSRLPWQTPALSKPLKTGKYSTYKHRTTAASRHDQSAQQTRVSEASPPRSACTCPRCRMPQSHNKHQGTHVCVSCGNMLHKKKELSLLKSQGRGRERSL